MSGHSDHPVPLTALMICLPDLNESIILHCEILEVCPSGNMTYSSFLCELTCAYQTGLSNTDLRDAIKFKRAAFAEPS